MQPATRDDFRRELTACLALCAPAGFDEATRREWLITAWATLNGIPADLLARGCRVARTYSDHPSKIIPTIMREIETTWNARKDEVRFARHEASPIPAGDGPRQIMEVVTPAQIEEIKAEFGIVTQPYGHVAKPTGAKPRKPTREDYIALGVSPDVLDRITDRSSEAA